MSIVWMAVVGLIVGALAKLIMPGTQGGGIIVTALLGIAGSLVAGFLGGALGFYSPGQGAGFIGSLVGALIVLFVYGRVRASRSSG